jgi:hypothetical protein
VVLGIEGVMHTITLGLWLAQVKDIWEFRNKREEGGWVLLRDTPVSQDGGVAGAS